MSLRLIIGNKNYSSWSLRPWFFLKNLGIEFEEELIFLFEDKTAENLSAFISNEKVPVLIDTPTSEQAIQVWDSLSIIEYIADKYPDANGWPQSSKARAIARSVSNEMHSSFNAVRSALPMNCRKDFPNYPINPEVQQDIDRIVDLWEYCAKNATKDGPWLFGELSGADAMFAPIALRFIGYDIKLNGFAKRYVKTVFNNQHIQAWIAAGKIETQIIEEDEV